MNKAVADSRKPLSNRVFMLFMLGIVVGALLPLVPSRFLPFFIGAYALLGLAFLSLLSPLLLVYVIILTSAPAGLFRRFESLDLGMGGLSVSGLRWVSVAMIILFVVGLNLRRLRVPRYLIPFLIFSVWVAGRWATASLDTVGLKDVLFYGLPPLIGVYTILTLSISKRPVVESIEKVILYSAFVPLFLYLFSIPSGLVVFSEKGPIGLVHPRPVALYLLVVVSLGLAKWRYATTKADRRLGAGISMLALGIIIFTLSRTATAIALLLFATFWIKPHKPWQFLLGCLLAVVLSVSLFSALPAFRSRLFHRPPSDRAEALELVNTSGRNVMWSVAFNHALEKPALGWGPGSARLLLGEILSKMNIIEGIEYHPHNEYLQVLHDTGIVGLALLLLAWLPMFFGSWSRWRYAHVSRDKFRAKWDMAATLGISMALLTAMIDNTLHYTFVLGPIFIIIACGDYLDNSQQGSESRGSFAL